MAKQRRAPDIMMDYEIKLLVLGLKLGLLQEQKLKDKKRAHGELKK